MSDRNDTTRSILFYKREISSGGSMLNTHCMDNQEIIDVGGIICLKNEFDSQLGRGGVGVGGVATHKKHHVP